MLLRNKIKYKHTHIHFKPVSIGSTVIKIMSFEEQKPKSFFLNKWYIREDLYPELFREDRHIINCNIMFEIGNCFNTKEETISKCNAIRLLVGAPSIS